MLGPAMIHGRIIRFPRRRPPARLIQTVQRHLLKGGAAVLPTETQYALSAVATNSRAVAAVRSIKGRSSGSPFSVFFKCADALSAWGVELPEPGLLLAEAFWPGPMTLVLPVRGSRFRHLGSARTIGVRVSPEPLLVKLCSSIARPLVATSANPSGLMLSIPEENHWLEGLVEASNVIWARPKRFRRRQASTVLDCSGRRVRVIRRGAIPDRVWRQALPPDML
jgi:L-threonylcarbamoyladenylate synthase